MDDMYSLTPLQLLPSCAGDIIRSQSLHSGRAPAQTPIRPIANSATECEHTDWLIQLSIMASNPLKASFRSADT